MRYHLSRQLESIYVSNRDHYANYSCAYQEKEANQ